MIGSSMASYVYVLIGVVAIVVVAGVVVAFAIHRRGSSYVTRRSRWRSRTGFQGKTVWDWLELLVVPVALAGIALGFNFLQSDREQEHEDARKQNELRIAAETR